MLNVVKYPLFKLKILYFFFLSQKESKFTTGKKEKMDSFNVNCPKDTNTTILDCILTCFSGKIPKK